MNQELTRREKVGRAFKSTILLFRSIPSPIVAFFVASVIMMNLLANKTIVQVDYLALDGGFLVSWVAFLTMDIVTKHFGPKAAIKLSIFASLVNLMACLIFYLVSIIPASENAFTYYFNKIFGGTWFILLSSTVAFISSAIVNNLLNYAVGKLFKNNPDGRLAYISRSYISTFIGQFVDNMIFAILCFMVFFPIFENFSWTFIQCLICSLVGASFELAMEIVFSPLGYRICRKWKSEGIGEQYFKYMEDNYHEVAR